MNKVFILRDINIYKQNKIKKHDYQLPHTRLHK